MKEKTKKPPTATEIQMRTRYVNWLLGHPRQESKLSRELDVELHMITSPKHGGSSKIRAELALKLVVHKKIDPAWLLGIKGNDDQPMYTTDKVENFELMSFAAEKDDLWIYPEKIDNNLTNRQDIDNNGTQ